MSHLPDQVSRNFLKMNGLITMLGTLLHLILGLNLVSADGASQGTRLFLPPCILLS